MLFELLSDRVLHDFSNDLWRELFVGPAHDTIRFHSAVVCFLSVAGLSPEWTRASLVAAAKKHRGHVEAFGPPATFAFSDVRHALELALSLQAESGGGLRMALLVAPCTMATFEVDGCQGTLSLGSEPRITADRARRAPEGALYVWGETWPLVARVVERHAPQALVAREIEDGLVTSALVRFPAPRRRTDPTRDRHPAAARAALPAARSMAA
jgi:hypothetical protein